MWLLKNDIFENPISIRTNTPNQWMYSAATSDQFTRTVGVKNHVLNSWESQKNHWYTVHCWFITILYCSVAIYAVLMHSMLFYCNMCCFIAIHAVLLPFCCNLRRFVATTWSVQNTRFPRHFLGGSQALSTFIDVCSSSSSAGEGRKWWLEAHGCRSASLGAESHVYDVEM